MALILSYVHLISLTQNNVYVRVDMDVAEDGQWVESNIKQNKNLINVKSNMWIQVGSIYVEF